MVQTADRTWADIFRHAWADLQPFDGRFGQAWRIALLCAIVSGVAMMYKIPEAAISCYLVIYLTRPDGAYCVAQGIGIIIIATLAVAGMAPVIQATADAPMMRIVIIAAASFAFVWLGSASQLGEMGSIGGLVVAFILTLVDEVPIGQVVSRGLIDAWKMAVMPMVLMIVFNLVLGRSPQRLLREAVVARLDASAAALEGPPAETARHVGPPLSEGNAALGQHVMLGGIFHTAPSAQLAWLSGAATTTYRLLLAVAALPASVAGEARAVVAGRCRAASAAIRGGARPAPESVPAPTDSRALAVASAALDGLAQPNGGTDARIASPPFFAADAFTNPDHQRLALKVTGAAVTCYLIYRIIDWPGIHTALITCYVVALGTTAETVHKLMLRIIGCLIGAAMGFAAILFVIPHLESVGGLMALVFCGVLVAAWVSVGSENISYAGVQVGLAFLLTILNGFAPSLSMDSGRDRVIGILLGNVVVYFFFTGIWPKSAAAVVRDRLGLAMAALSRLAALPPSERVLATAEAERVETETAAASDQIELLPFEPADQRPGADELRDLRDLVGEARALVPVLMFSDGDAAASSERLARVAAGVGAAPAASAAAAPDDTPDGEIGDRVHRIEKLSAGVTT